VFTAVTSDSFVYGIPFSYAEQFDPVTGNAVKHPVDVETHAVMGYAVLQMFEPFRVLYDLLDDFSEALLDGRVQSLGITFELVGVP